MDNFISVVPPPNLPLATQEYEARYQDQLNSILRLYFTRLDSAFRTVFGMRGGGYLTFPFGAYQHNADVAFTANTPTLVPLTVTDYESGMFRVPGDGVHVTQSGIYNYQYSLQFRNTDTQLQNAYVWLRKNGADLPNTASAFTIASKHGTIDGYNIGALNFYVSLMAGDYVELWAAVDNATVSLDFVPAQTTPYPRPGSPSAVVTVTFVSAV